MGNRQDAEDATQQAFLYASLKRQQYQGGSFQAWLLRIVTNVCLSELRWEKLCTVMSFDPLETEEEDAAAYQCLFDQCESPEEGTLRSELSHILGRDLKQLPLDYRMTVILVDIQELRYAEAAQVMGVCMVTLKNRLSLGRMYM